MSARVVMLGLLVLLLVFVFGFICGLWFAVRRELRKLKRWREVPEELRKRAFFSAVSVHAQADLAGRATKGREEMQ